MNKLTKILVSLVASFAISLSAFAGELTVTGAAKATYGTVSGQANGDNGLGVANELTFAASGELDNGWAWTYKVALDPDTTAAGGNALNDDSALTLTTNVGSFAICASDCGLSAALEFSADAYSLMSDTGYGEGKTEPVNISSYMNMQYHTPAGLLPFGIVGKVAYATSGDTSLQSSNASNITPSATVGSTTMYRIESAPIDGLKVNASYAIQDSANAITSDEQDSESGAIAAKYAMGNFTIGYGKAWIAPRAANGTTAGATTVEYYENTNYSIGVAVNDQMTISFTDETSEANYLTSTTVGYDVGAQSVQAAYTMGGMTLALARTNYDNVGYASGVDVTETVLAVSMAF
jgi:hypothetical protein